MNIITRHIKNILLVEDDLRDVELTLAALEEHRLANNVFVVHDGGEPLALSTNRRCPLKSGQLKFKGAAQFRPGKEQV